MKEKKSSARNYWQGESREQREIKSPSREKDIKAPSKATKEEGEDGGKKKKKMNFFFPPQLQFPHPLLNFKTKGERREESLGCTRERERESFSRRRISSSWAFLSFTPLSLCGERDTGLSTNSGRVGEGERERERERGRERKRKNE